MNDITNNIRRQYTDKHNTPFHDFRSTLARNSTLCPYVYAPQFQPGCIASRCFRCSLFRLTCALCCQYGCSSIRSKCLHCFFRHSRRLICLTVIPHWCNLQSAQQLSDSQWNSVVMLSLLFRCFERPLSGFARWLRHVPVIPFRFLRLPY